MVKDKDLWKHRSWELTVQELKTKQKKCRTNMWGTFLVWTVCFTSASFFYMIRFFHTSLFITAVSIMLLMVVMVWKYFEMNYSTTIEIRMIKNG